MAETTVITTIELTSILPEAIDREDYQKATERATEEFIRENFSPIDDLHVKAQLFVNDEEVAEKE